MDRMCYSCGAPLEHPDFKGESEIYCKYCVSPKGDLKPRKEILEGVAQWLREWQPNVSVELSLRRADHYLRAMPAWAEE